MNREATRRGQPIKSDPRSQYSDLRHLGPQPCRVNCFAQGIAIGLTRIYRVVRPESGLEFGGLDVNYEKLFVVPS
jgi:hypothetical protein